MGRQKIFLPLGPPYCKVHACFAYADSCLQTPLLPPETLVCWWSLGVIFNAELLPCSGSAKVVCLQKWFRKDRWGANTVLKETRCTVAGSQVSN